jgi:thioredoxin 1
MIKYITGEKDFDLNTGVVIVDFYADWCGPCKMIAPQLAKINEDYPELTILKVNIDELPALANKYGVTNIPTIDIYEQGAKKTRKVGFLPADRLLGEIESITTFKRRA